MKVIEESLIKEYAKKAEDIIRPLTGIPYPSIKAPEVEIRTIASKIQQLSHTAFLILVWSRTKPSRQSARSKERLGRRGLALGNLE